MNFLKKLRKDIAQKSKERRDHKTLKTYRTAGLAQQCMTCKHFVYREEKPRNWVCRCPSEKMRFVGNTCLGFQFGEHPEMIITHSR